MSAPRHRRRASKSLERVESRLELGVVIHRCHGDAVSRARCRRWRLAARDRVDPREHGAPLRAVASTLSVATAPVMLTSLSVHVRSRTPPRRRRVLPPRERAAQRRPLRGTVAAASARKRLLQATDPAPPRRRARAPQQVGIPRRRGRVDPPGRNFRRGSRSMRGMARSGGAAFLNPRNWPRACALTASASRSARPRSNYGRLAPLLSSTAATASLDSAPARPAISPAAPRTRLRCSQARFGVAPSRRRGSRRSAPASLLLTCHRAPPRCRPQSRDVRRGSSAMRRSPTFARRRHTRKASRGLRRHAPQFAGNPAIEAATERPDVRPCPRRRPRPPARSRTPSRSRAPPKGDSCCRAVCH